MEEWVQKPKGDGTYAFWGGYYKFWLTDDVGRFPDNLEIVKMEEMNEKVPKLLEPWIGGELPPMPHDNKTAITAWTLYYADPRRARIEKTLAIIEDKFKWTFDNGYYERLVMDG